MQSPTQKGSILIVDDDQVNLHFLEKTLSTAGYRVRATLSGPLALSSIREETPELILLDVLMPEMNGYQLCERFKADEGTRQIPVIFISALDEVENKLKGFSAGGTDYITKPFQREEVLARVETHLNLHRLRQQLQQEITHREQVEKALQLTNNRLEQRVQERTQTLSESNKQLEHEIEKQKKTERRLQKAYAEIQYLKNRLEQENLYLQEEIRVEHNFGSIIGQSDAINYPLYKVGKVAPTDTIVLIQGETGTGKELFARAIHNASLRKKRPLIKVNCATLPSNLIESELFGHEKGAFTGATAKRIGRFELADGATLFLDEIGELPLMLQAKLLRVLQDGEFERLGSSRTLRVDVRVIAATNRDLKLEVREGRFRQDLYYRLKVYDITIPPLRQRTEDIPLLLKTFLQKFSKKLGKQIDIIPQKTLDSMCQYNWPGNVRELEHAVEQGTINSRDNTLLMELPCPPSEPAIEEKQSGFELVEDKTLEELERDYILYTLRKATWKIGGHGGAAQILHMNPGTLRSRMKKLGIKRPPT